MDRGPALGRRRGVGVGQPVGEEVLHLPAAGVGGVGVELHQERRGRALRQRRHEVGELRRVPRHIEQHVVHHLHGRGVVLQDRSDVAHRRHHAVVGEHDDRRLGRNRLQRDGRLGDDGERPLAAGQESGQIHRPPLLGVVNQHVQVVPGDVPLQRRIPRLDLRGLLVDEPADLGVHLRLDRGAGLARRHRPVVEVVDVDPPERRAGTVREHHLAGLDVRVGLAVLQRVGAGGVVADGAAEDALVPPRGVGGELEPVGFDRVVQPGDGDPRTRPGRPGVGVDVDDLVHVPFEVEDDRLVDRLPRQAGAAATREHRDVLRRTVRHHRLDVVGRPRRHHPDRALPVGACVRREQFPRVRIEPHVAVDPGVECVDQLRRLDVVTAVVVGGPSVGGWVRRGRCSIVVRRV